MSFKREGNDSSQLNILKKRRVADLLSNFIPEDEAALLKNGRYTCLVCSYRPVFDTVDMLTVHRKSKKHLEGMKWYYGNKKELQNEMAKRQHQDYVLAEDSRQEASSSAPLLTQTRKIAHHALLKTVPYSSCHKKTSTKPGKEPASSAADINTRPFSTATSSQHQTIDQPSINAAYSTPTVNQGLCPSGKKNEFKTSESTVSHQPEQLTAQRRLELEHYLKLKSAGWLQDGSGQWVKDENVEFDSDEEEPAAVQSSPSDSTNNRPEDQRTSIDTHCV